MKRVIGVTLAVAVLAVLAGTALAQGPGFGMRHGPQFMGQGMGPSMMDGQAMGPGMMGGATGMGPGMMSGAMGQMHGMMGGGSGRSGPATCPGMVGRQGAGTSEQTTQEKGKEAR